jgi:hypothetical protein
VIFDPRHFIRSRAWIATLTAQRLAIYTAFIVYSLLNFLGVPGDDISSSYIGCRLLASTESSHLYDFHPELFHVVDTASWISAAADARFAGFLHPYVQTPLWAWMLQPLCTNLAFDTFSTIFLFVASLSLVVTIEIVARAWAGNFLKPFPMTVLLVAIVLSTPFKYAMWLVQTHALFLMLTVAALYLAQRNQSFKAGALLAFACAVKITPGILLLYWLTGRRYRAALWFVVCSLLLAALTVAVAGTSLTFDYILSMRRVSDVLLVSFNNQSLAAWLGYSQSMQSELGNWRMFPLTPFLKIVCLVASIVSVVLTGLMSKRHEWVGASAAIALIGITVSSPIAWSHYFLALIPAVMISANTGGLPSLAVVIITFMLNAVPVAINPIAPSLSPVAIVRSHLLSAIILMFATAFLCLRSDLNFKSLFKVFFGCEKIER